jgi:hypothetical protein
MKLRAYDLTKPRSCPCAEGPNHQHVYRQWGKAARHVDGSDSWNWDAVLQPPTPVDETANRAERKNWRSMTSGPPYGCCGTRTTKKQSRALGRTANYVPAATLYGSRPSFSRWWRHLWLFANTYPRILFPARGRLRRNYLLNQARLLLHNYFTQYPS